MPTYRACGVTVSLSTCALKPTVSSFTDLRMGNEQRKDAARIQKALSSGEKLGERPIGADGSEKGIVQFIGVHGNLPLFVVEASEQLRQETSVAEQAQSQQCLVPSSSPLTSLDATPTPMHDAYKDSIHGQSSSSQIAAPEKSKAKAEASIEAQTKPTSRASSQQAVSAQEPTLEQALSSAGVLFAADEKALVLDIEMEHKSFLPNKGGSGSLGKDLKIEVFVNGELADVSFINARRSAVQIIGDKIRFTGTRVHRQTEKPWVYNPEDTAAGGADAEHRWHTAAENLVSQARERGTDKYGDLQPSAEYLGALAAVPLPARVRNRPSTGFIDIIITAGKGQKYGPGTAYLTKPTPMDDSRFTTSNPAVDPLLLPPSKPTSLLDGGAVISPLRSMKLDADHPQQSSPDLQLKSHMASASTSPSPTKKAINLAREFGFDLTIAEGKLLTVTAFRNSRGRPNKEGRSLLQRLGDVKKMNEQNRVKVLAKLQKEISDLSESVSNQPPVQEQERPLKRARTDSDAKYIDPSKIDARPTKTYLYPSTATDDVFRTEPKPKHALTQNRIDIALDSGAAPSGPLLRRIGSASPVKTPRKTQAAALAYSPTRTAIKQQQKRRSSATSSPEKAIPFILPPYQDTGALPSTPPHHTVNTGVSPTESSGRGANRTATAWNPGEQSFTQALEGFEERQAFGRNCCVRFAKSKGANRQIGKARGGVFREDGVVVGVRFCVW